MSGFETAILEPEPIRSAVILSICTVTISPTPHGMLLRTMFTRSPSSLAKKEIELIYYSIIRREVLPVISGVRIFSRMKRSRNRDCDQMKQTYFT